MSNKFKIVLLLVLTALLVTGCNSKKKKNRTTPQGNVVFFHNIAGEGELQLKAVDTSQRNSFGTVDFEQFSSAVFLNAGNWGLNALDESDSPASSVVKGNFTVSADKLSLVAITENGTNTKYLFELPLSAGNSGRTINVAHLNKHLDTVDAYIIPAWEENADDHNNLTNFEKYKVTVSFGEASGNISLPVDNQNKQVYIYITQHGDAADLKYTAELREIDSYSNQTLIISPNHSLAAKKPTSIIYYRNGLSDSWADADDLLGELRVVNTYNSEIDANAKCTIDSAAFDRPLTSSLAIDAVSDYEEIPAEQCFYSIEAEDASGVNNKLGLYLTAGEQWSIIYYGDTASSELRSIKVKEDQNTIVNQARLTVTNATYFNVGDRVTAVDVFVYKSPQNPENLRPTFAELKQKTYVSKRLPATGSAGTVYQVLVAEAGTAQAGQTQVVAQGAITLKSNENYHLVIKGINHNATGICQVEGLSCQSPQ